MTFKTSVPLRFVAAALVLALPAMADAWQASPPHPAPPQPLVVVQPPTNARFQQTVRENQVQDQVRKNQVEEQLRQHQMDTARRPYAANAVHAARLDQADQAQRELYRARQQDLVGRYQSAVAPPVVHAGQAPAAAHSGG